MEDIPETKKEGMGEVEELNTFCGNSETAINERNEMWKSGAEEKGRSGSKKNNRKF